MSEKLCVRESAALLAFLNAQLKDWSRKTIKQRLQAGCVSVNGQTYLSFSRTIKEPEVERRVLSALIREGVPVVVESNRRINR